MSTPIISILIPVYNTGAILRETLDSALREAATVAAEVIALDDGSEIETAQILDSYADRIQVSHQANQGVSATRNTLAQQARGDWLLFLDADDLLLPQTLIQRLALASSGEADAIYCDWHRFRDVDGGRQDGDPLTRSLADVHADPSIALFAGFWSPPGAWLFRRELHERIGGFRGDLPVIQDARYALDAALVGARFGHAKHLGFAYREGQSQSLSQRNQTAFARDCLLHATQIEQVYAERTDLDDAARYALCDTFEYVARSLADTDQASAAIAVEAAWRYRNDRPSRWLRTARLLKMAFGVRWGMIVVARISNFVRKRS